MGELVPVDNDLDRIWIDSHSGGTCPFVPGFPGVNPISMALEGAGMRNRMRADSRFWIDRGRGAAVYSVSDTVELWLQRWTAMARRYMTDKRDGDSIEGISLVVDHAIRFIHIETSHDTYHRIVLTVVDRCMWILLLIIEAEPDAKKRASMVRELTKLFDVFAEED